MAAGPFDDARAAGAIEWQGSATTRPRVDELTRRRRTEDLCTPPAGGSGLDVPSRLEVPPREPRARLPAAERDALSAERDDAEARDYDALRRDEAADRRDRVMSERELSDAHYDGADAQGAAEIVVNAVATAARAAAHRADSARLRELAAADRVAAASDRLLAARDRSRALADRAALQSELERSRRETLLWARTEEPCLTDVEYELRRCRRVERSLVIACIDILAPAGHRSDTQAAKQQRHIVGGIRTHLRAEDLLVACGADRWVCAMPDLALDAAGRLVAGIRQALAGERGACTIEVGLAEVRAAEDAVDVVARAAGNVRP